MKNILDKIIEHKKIEIARCRQERTATELMQSHGFERNTLSLKSSLLDISKTGIIAEFKRRSPSKGIINASADVAKVTSVYTQYGASCLSVLTDEQFFGGSLEDLKIARQHAIPILRKDFMIDEYQILEARAFGADVILLIAACLSPRRVKELAAYAKKLSLEVLLEVHGEDELAHVCDEIDLVGVNNRNLKTFEVDIENSIRLLNILPKNKLAIAESGIDNVKVVKQLRTAGFSGFLIGENFMKNENPGEAFKNYVQQLKQVENEN
ncbi:indole-3-glycerol phosphate synthase TrpC [Arachidicoccus soli]|uniref:Indole-3-glycerol phosphate synthase n=1 Tax=Arachidicoccus soli TaxID=2341117 RepID=A0A386HP38_9BACT|nr:indole-3-glycerol phosphate synthase TrpC [Arachidicoccus soli]AYD47260.1 indole-3-glycerol phosphate synthase TrpC [Arachidicoccus soli]